jgi:thiol-disulfide isomerase/thioredoxin
MATFVEVVTKYVGPYKYHILALVLLIIFLVITATFYPTFLKNTENKEENDAKDVANSNRRNPVATIFFFNVDWCPHCKSAMPIWDAFVKEYSNKSFDGVTVNFVYIDCDKDSAAADKYGVTGYPTIKLDTGSEIIEFNSKPSSDTLLAFLQQSL